MCSRAGVISLAYTSSDQHNSLPRLVEYLAVRLAAGVPEPHSLFLDQNEFAASAMNPSSLGKRLQKHLQDAALYEVESIHK